MSLLARGTTGTGPRLPDGTWTAVLLGVITALAALGVSLAPAGARDLLGRILLLVIGIVAAWWLLRVAAPSTRSIPEQFDTALRHAAPLPTDLAELRAVDTTVRMATANAFGVEVRLKPLLRELTAWRLLRSRGVDLERDPELARHSVGEPLWGLTEPKPTRPEYDAPGVRFAELAVAVDLLERV